MRTVARSLADNLLEGEGSGGESRACKAHSIESSFEMERETSCALPPAIAPPPPSNSYHNPYTPAHSLHGGVAVDYSPPPPTPYLLPPPVYAHHGVRSAPPTAANALVAPAPRGRLIITNTGPPPCLYSSTSLRICTHSPVCYPAGEGR
jgi:hypothetical protein